MRLGYDWDGENSAEMETLEVMESAENEHTFLVTGQVFWSPETFIEHWKIQLMGTALHQLVHSG